jgi:AcrR family transcriptional regulator
MPAPVQHAAPDSQVGRPRDISRDEVIFRAVRELLAEEGYQAVSVNKVTLRCGVHVRTITRRWGTKAEMVAAAILGGTAPALYGGTPGAATGRLGSDLRALIGRVQRYVADPAIQAALPALLSEVAGNAGVRELFERREEEWTATIRAVLERAVDSGDAPARILGREQVLARVLAGTTYSLQFAPLRLKDDALAEELASFLMAALLGEA